VARKKGAAGVDHVTTRDFERRLPGAIQELSMMLKDGTYIPQAIRRVHIPKPGTTETRPLGIPTVRDRVVQAAVVNVVEPIFERDFAEHSYGFRPGRGCKDALRRVDALLSQGYVHVVDADLKGYFDSIPHDRLMKRLEEKIADGPTLRLIDGFLKADILDDAARWTPEEGAPQGAVLSPLLSNVYLDPLDHLLAEHGFEMVRYADDFVISTYRNVFNDVDGYVRRRLRGILDKRTKRRGAGRGRARQRWPNHYFAEQGLFSLAAAHATVVQSSRR
jgi:RNA-directed DNA polymerase